MYVFEVLTTRPCGYAHLYDVLFHSKFHVYHLRSISIYRGVMDGHMGGMYACGETRLVDYGFELELEFLYLVVVNYDVILLLR